jgi:hypothetical protein
MAAAGKKLTERDAAASRLTYHKETINTYKLHTGYTTKHQRCPINQQKYAQTPDHKEYAA